ncbi:MAG: PQQ-binding-like beta-propeller repeat protein [Pirellulales bacterium]
MTNSTMLRPKSAAAAARRVVSMYAAIGAVVFLSCCGALHAADATISDTDWPTWRGPLVGAAKHTGVPVTWSATENVKWQTPLDGPGNSSPIVVAGRVFLTAANEDGSQRGLLCFDAETGKQLWRQDLEAKPKELTHETNPYCASSPATDGKHVYVWHGSAGAAAYDFDGKRLWHVDLGEFTHIWGYAASPVVVDGKVILSCGPGVRVVLVALDANDGSEVWRRELAEAQSKDEKEFKGSWSTPTLLPASAGEAADQILISYPKELRSFNVATGADVWKCQGLSDLSYTSPLLSAHKPPIAVAMSGYTGPAIACRTGGTGDITADARLWLHDQKNPQRVGSGAIVGDHVFILNENGIAWCIELESGKKLWEERISSTSWSTMTHVDGRLYVSNMQGETLVLRPNAEKCEVIATNKVGGELTRASLAFAGRRIYQRTYKHLYCFEATAK